MLAAHTVHISQDARLPPFKPAFASSAELRRAQPSLRQHFVKSCDLPLQLPHPAL